MTYSPLTLSVLCALIASAGIGTGYWLASPHTDHATTTSTATPTAVAPQPLYWYDPMVPNQHFDKPGKSPFMDMDLVPKYADVNPTQTHSGIAIDSRIQQNLGIRLAEVESGSLAQVISAPATIAFNERDVAIVQTRTAGFVTRSYAHAPNEIVAAGTPLLEVLTPDWASAQAEFLALRQANDSRLLASARQRLRLLGMSEALIKQVEQTGKVHDTTIITAPITGMIQSLDVRQGMTVSAGMTVARLNGVASVWLEAAVPEAQAGLIKTGMTATATLAAYPEQTLTGSVTTLLPTADPLSRTVRVRLTFANPAGKLRPGLLAQVRLTDTNTPPTLLIPSEALIRTGKRTLVIVAHPQGHFEPVTVTTGAEADGKTAIVSGLQAGDKIVASGQFLIDSEASLQGVLARLTASSAPAHASSSSTDSAHHDTAAPTGIVAFGVFKALKGRDITLFHEPIPALEWPAMTMPFTLAAGVDATGLKVGQRVRFVLTEQGDGMS